MKKLFDEIRKALKPEADDADKNAQEEFDKSFRDSLKYVKKFKEAIAYDLACDWEENKQRTLEYEMELRSETKESDKRNCAHYGAERQLAEERLLQFCKSKSPGLESSPDENEPDLDHD
jgi:hypothetical protein